MRSRTEDMWWGTAIEAPDPAALAGFYSELLEWPIVHQEPGTSVVAAPAVRPSSCSSSAEGYVPPVWPPVEGQQRTMTHFDFQVGDLDSAAAEAVALGARVAEPSRRTTSGCCSTRQGTRSACAATTGIDRSAYCSVHQLTGRRMTADRSGAPDRGPILR